MPAAAAAAHIADAGPNGGTMATKVKKSVEVGESCKCPVDARGVSAAPMDATPLEA